MLDALYLFAFSAPWFIYCTIEKLKNKKQTHKNKTKDKKKCLYFYTWYASLNGHRWIQVMDIQFMHQFINTCPLVKESHRNPFTGYKCIWPRLSTRAHQSDVESIDLNISNHIHAINTSNHHYYYHYHQHQHHHHQTLEWFWSCRCQVWRIEHNRFWTCNRKCFRFSCEQCTNIRNDCFYFWAIGEHTHSLHFFQWILWYFHLNEFQLLACLHFFLLSVCVLFQLNVIKMIFNWFHFAFTFFILAFEANWYEVDDGQAVDRHRSAFRMHLKELTK